MTARRIVLLCCAMLAWSCDDNEPATPTATSSSAAAAASSSARRKPTSLAGRRLKIFRIENAESRHAVCNDGTPAHVFTRRGKPDHAGDWVIFLQGGGSCQSEEGCKKRRKERRRLTTSKGNDKLRFVGGIFNSDARVNPDFAGFNHVYVPYCSSDSWMGDREGGEASFGWHFRGKRIIAAVIEDLLKRDEAPTLKHAKLVLLAGSSAGANGVKQNLDDVAAMLPHAKVLGVNDAAFSARLASDASKVEELSKQRAALWQPKPDASCVEADGVEKCLDGLFVAQHHIATPMFVRMDQSDALALDNRGIKKTSAEHQAFSKGVRALLAKRDGAFGPRTGRHVALTDRAFMTHRIDGHSMAQVLANWVYGRNAPKNVVQKR